jgi:glycerate kinase
VLGARAVRGAELVADAAGIDVLLAEADLCLTAEGRIDGQTLSGKVVAEVAARAVAAAVVCVAVGGVVEPAAAAELGRRGCQTLEQGDLDLAGGELAARRW